jgi:hypothetical protein
MNEKNKQIGLLAIKMQEKLLESVNNTGVLEKAIIGNLDSVKKALDANLDRDSLMIVQYTYLLTRDRMKQLNMNIEEYDKKFYSLISQEINITNIQN